MGSRPTALIVLGMHRSGTSAVAGCVQLLGVDLGGPLLPANYANERGYFELAEIVAIHDEFLREFGIAALDVGSLPAGWERTPAAEKVRERLREVLIRNFGKAPLWALKDPRICLLLPLWRPLLEELGVAPRFLLVFRRPWEVVESLRTRDDLTTWEALDIWRRHSSAAELETRGAERAVLTYDELLETPEIVLGRVAERLAIEWPRDLSSSSAEIRLFLDGSLRHHRTIEPPADLPREVFSAVRSLARALSELKRSDADAAWKRIDRLKSECEGRLFSIRPAEIPSAHVTTRDRVRWIDVPPPVVLRPGEARKVRVTFRNDGEASLLRRALFVSYHWREPEPPFRVVTWDGLRTPVGRALDPEEEWSGDLAVVAPVEPGDYLLEVDLVREGVVWFANLGVTAPMSEARVSSRPFE